MIDVLNINFDFFILINSAYCISNCVILLQFHMYSNIKSIYMSVIIFRYSLKIYFHKFLTDILSYLN